MTIATDTGLVHRAVAYRTPEHHAEVLRGPLSDALEHNQRAFVVVEPRCRAELERTLGHSAGIEFHEPERVHTAPPFTVAGRWGRAARDAVTGGAGRICAVGQPLELPGTDPAYWTRLDLALTHAMQDLPVTLLCSFADTDGARADVGQLHDELLVDGDRLPSRWRRDEHELLAENPQPPPADLGEPLFTVPVDLGGLARMRRLVERQARLTGFGPHRVADLVLAVNELVSNGIEHGSGRPTLRAWRTPGALVAEMSDPDACRLTFPGLAAPPVAGARGRGLWLASELTDVLQVWTSEDDPGQVHGTVVRVTMTPP